MSLIFTIFVLEATPMEISQYLDSTYLKTAQQAAISVEETKKIIIKLVEEAIVFNFKLVMIRANYISLAKELIIKADSNVLVGTVIGFHEGTYSIQEKLIEAQQAIDLGADDLDFVVNYKAFQKGNNWSY